MATTTNFGFNTPNDTDLVKDGALAMRTLGDNVDARFGNVTTYPNQLVNVVSGISRPIAYAMADGLATIPAPTALNTLSTVAITFPASRFTQPPLVVVGAVTGNTNPRSLKADNITTSGFTAGQWQTAGGSFQSTGVHYIAIQMTSAASAG
jgi:hypothetical protein